MKNSVARSPDNKCARLRACPFCYSSHLKYETSKTRRGLETPSGSFARLRGLLSRSDPIKLNKEIKKDSFWFLYFTLLIMESGGEQNL